MVEFVSALDKKCRARFEHLLDLARRVQMTTHPESRIQESAVADEYDRYKIWSANNGAAHSGVDYKKSLDYRLREALFYKEKVRPHRVPNI